MIDVGIAGGLLGRHVSPLLRPGQLGTWREFSRKHLMSGDRRRDRDPNVLRALTSQILTRTRPSCLATIKFRQPPFA